MKLCLSKAVLHRPHSQIFLSAVSKPNTKTGKKHQQGNQWKLADSKSNAAKLLLSSCRSQMLYNKTGCKHDFQSWIPVSVPP